ncbi:hypothetical protein M0R72_05760 [Candidatus Pacearchaeota archaeon]|jgi:hypothetical protein|nr:hypothetical protein [Candidatus Pacearchaeota archaeon]
MEQTKTGDMTLAQIIQGIETRETGFFVKANAVLGEPTVQTLIKEHQEKNKGRSYRVGLSVIQAAIKQAIRIKSAEQVTALCIGQRDTTQLSAKGKRLPGHVTFLRPKGQHFEIAVWGNSLKKGDGAPADIVMPSVVRMSVEKERYTTKNNDIGESIKLLDVIDVKELDTAAVATKLLGNIKTKKLGDISDLDQYQVVVIQGKISGINPIPVFSKTSEGDEINKATWEKTGELPLLMPDDTPDKLLHPVLQIALAIEQGTAVRVSLDQRRSLHGVYLIEDLQELVTEAYDKYPDQPEKQAAEVSGLFIGRPILAVGTMRGIRAGDATNSGIRNVDISASAVIDVPEDLPILANDAGQTVLPVEKTQKNPGGDSEPIGDAGASGTPGPKNGKEKSQSDIISEIVEEFPNICRVFGMKNITDRPLEEIIKKTKLDKKYDRMLIEVAYNSKLPKEDVSAAAEVPQDDGKDDEL